MTPPAETELEERLRRYPWMLRDVFTCFELIPRTTESQLLRVCKLCEQPVRIWERQKHLRAHQQAARRAKKLAERRRSQVALANLNKASKR